MSVTNDLFVGKGKMLSVKGRKFEEGRRFPAADLGIDVKSFESLVRDGSIVAGKVRNEFMHPELSVPAAPPAPLRVPLTTIRRVNAQRRAKQDTPPDDGLEKETRESLAKMAADLGIAVTAEDNKGAILSAIRASMAGVK